MKQCLALQHVTRIYTGSPQPQGIRDLCVEVPRGEGFSLLGPSGCGKSTTLRTIGGFEKPDSGSIRLNGVDITHLPPQKRNVRTVFQKYALFPHLNVWQNITFGLKVERRSPTEIGRRGREILEMIDISHLSERSVQMLSGGEQQRVALARALIAEPEVLLLDEPLAALDLKLRERMQLELLALRQRLGTTFIFVTHDQTEAMALSDRIGVMKAGRIVQIGTPDEIYSKPNSKFVASFIGQANFIEPGDARRLLGNETLGSDTKNRQEWMVRPERIVPVATSTKLAADTVGMRVTLRESAFLGAQRLTKFVDATHKDWVVQTSGSQPLIGPFGSEALLTWRREDMWALSAD